MYWNSTHLGLSLKCRQALRQVGRCGLVRLGSHGDLARGRLQLADLLAGFTHHLGRLRRLRLCLCQILQTTCRVWGLFAALSTLWMMPRWPMPGSILPALMMTDRAVLRFLTALM